jgi:small subunit ribosomal protein S21
MSDVRVGEMESLESALKRFNKQVMADGILSDARKHQYYEKPSVLRKKKAAASVRKLRKAALREEAKERR